MTRIKGVQTAMLAKPLNRKEIRGIKSDEVYKNNPMYQDLQGLF